MYQQYFHFSELPFSIAPDPHFMYMSERHQEGLAHLLYGINRGGGFVALTGEVGTGKTTLCRCLLQQLPANIDIALILNPKLNAIELLTTICDELGIDYRNEQTLKNFVDSINQYLLTAYANGRRTVLLIDEAQNLSMEVLEQLRLLTNLETSKTKLLQIVLVGQPELKQLLKRQELRQLNQRITARYHLLPLSLEETRSYIRHRLIVSNGNPELFKDRAIRTIYRFSSGIPRIINILCDRALLGAYATNARSISSKIIFKAARETLGHSETRYGMYAAIALLLFGSIIAGMYFFEQHPDLLHQAGVMITGQAPLPDAKPVAETQQAAVDPEPEIEVAEQPVPEPEVKSFADWLDDPGRTLEAGMSEALKVWKKDLPDDTEVDCAYIASVGLRCLFDKADWKELLALDRPAIMEFASLTGEKHYALLTGVDSGRSLMRFDDDKTFPMSDVLNLWNGYYLILWQPPLPSIVEIAPQQSSSNVLWLRKQLSAITGVASSARQPLYFDEGLRNEVINFQRQHHLMADGIVGAHTLIHLENEIGDLDSPRLEITN